MAPNTPRKYFGTDGVRGKTNNGKMNAVMVVKFGYAVGTVFGSHQRDEHHRALICKDPRLSNYMFEGALQAGFTAVGMDVLLTGPIPTPGAAWLTDSMRASVGVMLTASHNPYHDNGIKLFGPDGYKLTEAQELEIERLMDLESHEKLLAPPHMVGRAKRIDDAQGQYVAFVKSSLPRHMSFAGMRVVVDCAHGAAYEVAPRILRELDAEVFTIGADPTGLNINEDCGSTHPDAVAKEVRRFRADLGIALDGDGDRVTLVDETGGIIDGDQVLAIIANSWKDDGRLTKPAVVGTIMSNLGLERFLRSRGITLERTDVGDQHILRRMREEGYNVGGEQSGHIVLSDYTKTGDGLLAALQVMSVIKKRGQKASEVCNCFEPTPQILENVKYNPKNGNPLEQAQVKAAIEMGYKNVKEGRLIVRPSGTEPLIRIMAEGDDKVELQKIVDAVAEVIQSVCK